jgi:hypothetical protein
MALVLAAFGVFSCVVTAGLSNGAVVPDVAIINNTFVVASGLNVGAAQMVLLILLALVITAALAVGQFACRGCNRPIRLCLCLFGALLVLVCAVGLLLHVFALATSGGQIEWSLFFVCVLVVAAATFATILPFLILSWASPFFREQLMSLLQLKDCRG